MKIVFLSFYSGQISRGMETVVDALASRFIKTHQVSVIQSGPSSYKNYKVIQLPVKDMKWPEVNPTGMLRRYMLDYYYRKIAYFTFQSLPILNKLNPDIVFSVNGGWMSLISKMYTKARKAKLVISGQAGLGRDDRWNLLCRPDLFVALSQRNTNWAKAHAPSVNIETIPNGVDLNRFNTIGEKYPINLRHPVVCCVAGTETYKRVTDTIKAVAATPDLTLLLVGGSEKDGKLGSSLLGDRFQQIKVKHEGMPNVYRSCDMFTLVSESYEAFGVSYLEAMASGLPVVATDDELRREIVGEAGVYVKDPDKVSQYAQSMEEALHKNWGDIPRKQAEKYDWDKIAQQYIEEFEKLVR